MGSDGDGWLSMDELNTLMLNSGFGALAGDARRAATASPRRGLGQAQPGNSLDDQVSELQKLI